MYIFPEMIDLGLMDNQKWPSDSHREVAQSLALSNPRITSRDSLAEICQAIIKIPSNRIKTVTLDECSREFKIPFIE